MKISDNKKRIIECIDSFSKELSEISSFIFTHPEMAFQEKMASDRLAGKLREIGFSVTKPYAGLETAFCAEFSQGEGPQIDILCEYDSLSIGHACGHHLIAAAGLGAAWALYRLMKDDSSIQGRVRTVGTPAEESGGGKIIMLQSGAFTKTDILLLMHPTSGLSKVAGRCKSSHLYQITYYGKAAHASSHPDEGKNSQDAAVICYQAIGCTRYMLKPDVAVMPLITAGNISDGFIPSETKMEVRIKSYSEKSMQDAKQKIENCIKAAAVATGCDYEIREEQGYLGRVVNATVGDMLRNNLSLIGEALMPGFVDDLGGEDFGDLSRVIPGMMVYPSLLPEEKISNHTERFMALANSPRALDVVKIGAKSMAMTALDFFSNLDLVEKAWKELEERQLSAEF